MLRENFETTKTDIKGMFQSLSKSQRLDVLEAIFSLCGTSELTYLCSAINRLQKRDFISFLPAEVVELIFGFLDLKTLSTCCLVSKSWDRNVESCETIWQKACSRLGWDNLGSSTWKQAYGTARETLAEIQNPTHVKINTLHCHKNKVTAVLKYDSKLNLMATGSIEGNVQLWDLDTNLCIRSVDTHSCAVLDFNEDILYTGSYDNTIASWRWKDGLLVRKFIGHTGAVFSISIFESENILLSGSSDQLVYLWNKSTAQILQVILQRCLVASPNHSPGEIVKLSLDKHDIREWLNTEKSVVLKDSSSESDKTISRMTFNGSQIAACCGEHVLVWNFSDYTLARQICIEPSSVCVGVGKNWILCVKNHSLHLLPAVYKQVQPLVIKNNILTQWDLPHYHKTNHGNNMAIGPSCWLDGRTPVDGQMLFAIGAHGGCVCIMTWRDHK